MNYIEKNNQIIIHGGFCNSSQRTLNDINIINISNMNWY